MKCSKCDKEIAVNSRFCSNCGAVVEEKPIDVETMAKECAKAWYILGYVRGRDKNNQKALDKLDNAIKNCNPEMRSWYKEIVDYWSNWAKRNTNEEDKKTNGSK